VGADGRETTLLSYDDARTLFHEFGHGKWVVCVLFVVSFGVMV
jgi:hypothetical protein